jgi:glycerate dehydrogenase
MTRIVVLDGHTTSPLSADATPDDNEVGWQSLAVLGELEVNPRTPADQVAERIGDAPVALTNKVVFDAAVFQSCPGLKYVGVLATGVNVVDLDAARAYGVTVTNVPGYSTASVAQHVFALLLELASRVAEHDKTVHDGGWANCDDFSFTTGPLVELSGLTLGVVGTGAIGRAAARIGHAMGMTIAAHSRTERDLGFPVDWMSADELFERADVVTLHCPLTDETKGLVNADRLSRMKRSAYLINTGRGPLIDEVALAEALRDGELAGAGLDVLSSEPPSADNPLLTAPNCVITPHVAWASVASRRRLMQIAADNLRGFLDGSPVNVVS